MRRERACKGCDGTGCIYAPEHNLCVVYDHAHACLACRGTGRVIDHIPAADAVADAETLRRAAEAWHRKPNVGAPCSICGCPAKRLKALHRRDQDGGWSKNFKVCFGTDSTVEKFGGPGWPA